VLSNINMGLVHGTFVIPSHSFSQNIRSSWITQGRQGMRQLLFQILLPLSLHELIGSPTSIRLGLHDNIIHNVLYATPQHVWETFCAWYWRNVIVIVTIPIRAAARCLLAASDRLLQGRHGIPRRWWLTHVVVADATAITTTATTKLIRRVLQLGKVAMARPSRSRAVEIASRR
jgi:hypothetical protein